MWSTRLTRKGFVEALSKLDQRQPIGNVRVSNYLNDSLVADEVELIWFADPGIENDFPQFIVVNDDVLFDFFAWAATFLVTFRPITSYFRVLRWSDFQLLEVNRRYRKPELSESAFIGAILGEILTEYNSRKLPNEIGEAAAKETYSFCMARAIQLYKGSIIPELVSNRWFAIRERIARQSIRVRPSELLSLWTVLMSLDSFSEFEIAPENVHLRDYCIDLLEMGRLREMNWNRLSSRLDYFAIHQGMSERKEDRIPIFEKLLTSIPSDVTPITQSFFVAYIASLIGERNFEHTNLLLPLVREFPAVLIWYGVIIGLVSNTRFPMQKSVLPRRLERELLRSLRLDQRTDADISADELFVLSNSERSLTKQLQATGDSLNIEFFPGVVGTFSQRNRERDVDLQRDSYVVDSSLLVSKLTKFSEDFEKLSISYQSVLKELSELSPQASFSEVRRKKER